jgi:hypothetical protein
MRTSIVKPQSDGTLEKYGLTRDDLRRMWVKQRGRCAVCKRNKVQLLIDHEHVRGWKRMEPSERKKYVRGLLCRHCNHRIVHRYAKIPLLRQAILYLEAYQKVRRTSTRVLVED